MIVQPINFPLMAKVVLLCGKFQFISILLEVKKWRSSLSCKFELINVHESAHLCNQGRAVPSITVLNKNEYKLRLEKIEIAFSVRDWDYVVVTSIKLMQLTLTEP